MATLELDIRYFLLNKTFYHPRHVPSTHIYCVFKVEGKIDTHRSELGV